MLAIKQPDIATAVQRLSLNQLLCSGSELDVYIANGKTSPEVVDSITAIRDRTIGHSNTLLKPSFSRDVLDEYYFYLFVWQKKEQRIVAGYRFAQVDRLLPSKGVEGLASSSQFLLRPPLVGWLKNTIELGRLFVLPDVRYPHEPIMLMRYAIAGFLYHNPRYRFILGSVNITNDYRPISKQLMVNYLRDHHQDNYRSGYTTARQPFGSNTAEDFPGCVAERPATLDQLSKKISELETVDKRVPVAITQCLNFGAQFLGFHMDRKTDSIACLMQIDLCRTPYRVLATYMGSDRVDSYQAYHRERLSHSA